MNNTRVLIVTAAVSGLLGGTTAYVHAQTTSQPDSQPTATGNSIAGIPAHLTNSSQYTAKHSCKGKNDCKGQGGCKSSDNGCKGKNSCQGKGGCATDGSPMPKI